MLRRYSFRHRPAQIGEGIPILDGSTVVYGLIYFLYQTMPKKCFEDTTVKRFPVASLILKKRGYPTALAVADGLSAGD